MGLSPARLIPFHLTFSSFSTHSLVAYLFLIVSAQTYKYLCTRLAEMAGNCGPRFPLSRVCSATIALSFCLNAAVSRRMIATRRPSVPTCSTARSRILGNATGILFYLLLHLFLELTCGHDVCHSPALKYDTVSCSCNSTYNICAERKRKTKKRFVRCRVSTVEVGRRGLNIVTRRRGRDGLTHPIAYGNTTADIRCLCFNGMQESRGSLEKEGEGTRLD